MIVSRKFFPFALAVYGALCATSAASAQTDTAAAHPNFSGRWRMVKDKSDFARAAMPDMIIRVVDQQGVTMNVHTIQTTGTTTKTADVSYFIDGSPSTNVINNHQATSKTFWDGSVLEVRTTMKLSNGDDELIEDRWELSDNGNTLTTTSHVSTPKGGTILKLVCEKEKTGS
ncbi:MAG TPA: hypothetical protein VFA65_14515 [Bryobacteraceae bacterium]|nr:hypothetical protein [Bryobacteraceae bacterium]